MATGAHAEPFDANMRNMAMLLQLRWIAIGGQLLTVMAVTKLMGIPLALPPLLAAPLLLLLVNVLSLVMLRVRRTFSNAELFAALMLDVLALTWQLYNSGGATNPFTFLFLLQIAIGAIILRPGWSWLIALTAGVAMLILTFSYVPLSLPPAYAADPLNLYLRGSLVSFLLIAMLLVVFVTGLDRNRRESDAEIAALRQQAIEEAHIIRMGLLASGAAHELGTPLASMSVILGDWARLPEITRDPNLSDDVADMQAELQRCKTIVSGILMSAGEIRGENPAVTSLRAFVGQIVAEWRDRTDIHLNFEDHFGTDLDVVSDPALKQVIGNVIDNAVEVATNSVTVRLARFEKAMTIDVRDDGPGFSAEMIGNFGKPYSSTKGRPGGGLGLFLVVNVLRKLGGKVAVGNPEGGGALVRLTIPLASLAYKRD